MAYGFNGTNQYFAIGSPVLTETPITMACLFKVTTQTTGSARVLFDIRNISNSSFFRMVIPANVSGLRIVHLSNNAGGQATTASGTIVANTWLHGTCVFTNNNLRTVYINAENQVSNTDFAATPTVTNTYIGATVLASTASGFVSGSVAEVGIWNAALTAAEIASLAKGMTCDKVRPQNLVFYAPLVRDLNDQKGGRVIINNNAATVAAHPRIYP